MPKGILPGGAKIPSASVWILWSHLLHRKRTSLTGLVDTWCFSLAAQTPLEFLNIERHPAHGPLEARAGFTGPSQSSSRWAPAGAAPSPLLARVAGWDQQHRPPRKSSFRLKHLSPLTSSLKPRQGHLRPTVGTCRGALAQIQAESFTLTASSNAGKRDSGWGPHLPGFTVQWGRSATKHTDPSISGRYSVEYL